MKQYVVDAFTDRVFHGNQAAVCVLDAWLPEELMMNITRENNFSETAFTVREGVKWHLRWFTPGGEIDLCGHAFGKWKAMRSPASRTGSDREKTR